MASHRRPKVKALTLVVATAFLAPPLAAQDMNTLNRHLEQQQWQRMQDHQNRMRQGKTGTKQPGLTTARPTSGCSADALPASERRRMEAEYARRAKSDGKASADAWVREQGKRFHQKLVAEGACADPSSRNRIAR